MLLVRQKNMHLKIWLLVIMTLWGSSCLSLEANDDISETQIADDAVTDYNRGVSYEMGVGVEQDKVEAAKWYALAASKGHAKAQSSLGIFYANGFGVAKDLTKALELYRLAALQGDDAALLNLGVMTSRGEGVAENFEGGLILMGLAARGGNQLAKDNLAMAGVDHTDLKFEELLETCIKITLVKCLEINSEQALAD